MCKRWPRQPFVGLLLSALLGIGLGELWRCPWWLPVALALALGGALCVVRSSPGVLMFALLVFCGLHRLESESPARELSRVLEKGPIQVKATGVVTEVADAAAKRVIPLRVRLKELRCGEWVCNAPIEVSVLWKGPPPGNGDRVAMLASASNIAPARNPGEFDMRGYLRRRGIYSELLVRYAKDAVVLESSRSLRALALRLRRRMEAILKADLDGPTGSLITSMVLGARGETPPEIFTLFRETGTAHLFAVSGLNVGMFAVMLWALLKPFGLRKQHAAPLLAATLFCYALITGWSASAVRAAIMGALALVGLCLDCGLLLGNVLAAAAVLILLANTQELFSPGFQLSFAVVGAIVLGGPRVEAALGRFGADPFVPAKLRGKWQQLLAWLAPKVGSLLAVSMAAWCGSLPFTLFYFHMLTPTAVLNNLLVVPLAFAVLALAMLSLLFCGGPVSLLFNNANWGAAQVLLQLVRLSAALPGSCLHLASPELSLPEARVVVFDLGSGAAASVVIGMRAWLLDCGAEKDARRVIVPALHQSGIQRLEGLILTHGDSGHLGGAQVVLEEFAPVTIAVPSLADRSPRRRSFELELCRRGIPKTLVTAADRLGAQWYVLYPPNSVEGRSADDQALVLQLRIGATRVLFTSDAGFIAEQWLLNNVGDLRSDLLVTGRHGSDPPCSGEFLSRVQPQLIISAGDRFRPNSELADRAGALGIPRLGQRGAVTITISGDGFTVEPFLGSHGVYSFSSRAR